MRRSSGLRVAVDDLEPFARQFFGVTPTALHSHSG
jgi:hypothetical protein